MKNRNLFKKTIVNAAILFEVCSLMFVFGCKNPIEPPKASNDNTPKTISITITGDAYLKDSSKKSFKVSKGTTWDVIQKKDEIKKIEFESGYQLSRWLLKGKNGSVPTDTFKFNTDTILYVESEQIPENSAHISWEIIGQGGSLKAEYIENGNTKELPAGGKKIPLGTKIIFTALPDTYYAVDSWSTGGTATVSSDKLTATLTVKDKQSIKVILKFIKVTFTQKFSIKFDNNKINAYLNLGGPSWQMTKRFQQVIRYTFVPSTLKKANSHHGKSTESHPLQ